MASLSFDGEFKLKEIVLWGDKGGLSFKVLDFFLLLLAFAKKHDKKVFLSSIFSTNYVLMAGNKRAFYWQSFPFICIL